MYDMLIPVFIDEILFTGYICVLRWLEGISILHVNKDGLVTKHRIDRVSELKQTFLSFWQQMCT